MWAKNLTETYNISHIVKGDIENQMQTNIFSFSMIKILS